MKEDEEASALRVRIIRRYLLPGGTLRQPISVRRRLSLVTLWVSRSACLISRRPDFGPQRWNPSGEGCDEIDFEIMIASRVSPALSPGCV